MSGAVRVRAEDNGCGCPACQLYGLLVAAGHEVDGEAYADFHAHCTAVAVRETGPASQFRKFPGGRSSGGVDAGNNVP